MAAAALDIPTGTWTLEKSHTTIGFVARHLMVTRVRGRFAEFDGTVEVANELSDSKVNVSLVAASVTTGAEDRDGHLRSADFFDVETCPRLQFVSTRIERQGERWIIRGDLTIKDITRPVELVLGFGGPATDPWGNSPLAFTASAEVNREDWGLTWNVALEQGGLLVSKTARLEIETHRSQRHLSSQTRYPVSSKRISKTTGL